MFHNSLFLIVNPKLILALTEFVTKRRSSRRRSVQTTLLNSLQIHNLALGSNCGSISELEFYYQVSTEQAENLWFLLQGHRSMTPTISITRPIREEEDEDDVEDEDVGTLPRMLRARDMDLSYWHFYY